MYSQNSLANNQDLLKRCLGLLYDLDSVISFCYALKVAYVLSYINPNNNILYYTDKGILL